MRVLISGASVAGPALAHWLVRYGFEVTVVELAPALRGGGRAVDFRGETHLGVLERMGVLEELRALRTGGSPMTFVDERGRGLMSLPADFAGGEVEVLRSDLSRVLHEHSAARYVFGDSITALTETPNGVEVRFRSGAEEVFDLVVGADGVHSNVRRLVFGPEERFVAQSGYYVATWDMPNYLGVPFGSVNYNVPGKLIALGRDYRDVDRAYAFAIFKSPRLEYDRHDESHQRRLLKEAYAGLGWETPRLLESLDGSTELYFDSISQVSAPTWSRGRVTLLGDAACGATLGGMGTGTAVVAAYVLAGELATARGDHRTAFRRYEEIMRTYAPVNQRSRPGPFLAPATSWGLKARNALLRNRFILGSMLKATKKLTTTLSLPAYPTPAMPSSSHSLS